MERRDIFLYQTKTTEIFSGFLFNEICYDFNIKINEVIKNIK